MSNRHTIRVDDRNDPYGLRLRCGSTAWVCRDGMPKIQIPTTINPFIRRINPHYGSAKEEKDCACFGIDLDHALNRGCAIVVHRYGSWGESKSEIEWLSDDPRIGFRWYGRGKTCWEMEVCMYADSASQLPEPVLLSEDQLVKTMEWTNGLPTADTVTRAKLELDPRIWDTIATPEEHVQAWHAWLRPEDYENRNRGVAAMNAADDFMRQLGEQLASC